MKFFLPHQEDKKLVIDAYDAIKKLTKRTTGWDVTDRKIYYIKYHHEGRDYEANTFKVPVNGYLILSSNWKTWSRIQAFDMGNVR